MDQEKWDKAISFHGHACPGLAIGFRAAEAAVETLGISPSKDEEVVCVTENDACGVDAIQALLGCTFGKGNLIYRPTGKHAFSFFDRNTGRSMRICLKAQNDGQISKDEWQERLLTLPLQEVFSFSTPRFEIPSQAHIFNTVICEECGEGAPEYTMRLQNGKIVCLDCFEDYQRN
jgi:formylmethanofuran dehydrogenase subunit E